MMVNLLFVNINKMSLGYRESHNLLMDINCFHCLLNMEPRVIQKWSCQSQTFIEWISIKCERSRLKQKNKIKYGYLGIS